MGLNLLRPWASPRRVNVRSRRTPRNSLSLGRLEDRLAPALGTFELDGNATTQSTHDWDQVYNDVVLSPGQNTSGAIPGAVFFNHDPVNSPTDDIFTGGSTADINDVSQWQWKPGTPQGKADIADAYAVAYHVPVGGQTHTIINFGADRYDNVGATTVGIWLFQNPIIKNPNGTFSGTHTVGDIFVAAESSSGVATVNVYRWVGPGGSQSSLQLLTTSASNVFATLNTANTPSGGWPFTDKGGTTPANTFATGEFFEGGIDLTALGLPDDLSSFVLETRGSNALTAVLSDFVIGKFDTSPSDLAVTKTVSNPTPNVGDTITFTVSLTNNGPGIAKNIVLADLLPAGLSFVLADPSQGTYIAATGLWSVGTLQNGAGATLSLRARVDTPDARTNTATIRVSSSNDPNPANDTASATVTPQGADLAVTKSVSNATPTVGDQITFTITVTNAGPNAATGVKLEDLLPAGLIFVSSTRSQGLYNPATGVWTVGTVTTGTTQTLTITATVVSPKAETNTAAITGADQFDPNTANNTDSATETPQLADLAVAKAVSDDTPNLGEQITFIVTLTNKGPNTATGVQVTDLLPAGVTYVSATASQGTYTSNSGLWNVGTVAPGTPQTLAIVATVVSPAAQTNTATITDSDQFDPVAGNNTASAVETPQLADLAVLKSVSNPTPNVGDTITFTITAINSGPNAATNVIVNDLLPAGVTFVSDNASQGTYDDATGIWTIGPLAPSATETLTITVTVDIPTQVVNTATIDGDQFDPNTGNNTASTSSDPQAADLAIIKSVSDTHPSNGDTITYTLGVVNTGPNTATGVTVADLLPVGVTFVSFNASQGTYDDVTGIWTVGAVASGATANLTINVTVDIPGQVVNTATVAGEQFDPIPGNNTDSTSHLAKEADLLLLKTVSDPTPNVDDQITFTVALFNSGPDTAEGVQVTDLLPAGLDFVSYNASQGTYDSATGLWDVGTVAPGTPLTLAIVATVVSTDAQTNTATITGGDRDDPNLGNNTNSATETPRQADVAVTKTVSNPTPNVGDVITFTVTVTNLGPNTATGVQVTDLLPPGLTPVLTRARKGTFASQVWDVGTLAPGESSTLTIIARVDSPIPQTNTATITAADQFDPNLANNTASATETPPQSDLSVTKSVSNARPNVGDTIIFTITLSNSGPNPATGVTVADLLPAGLTYVSSVASQGSYDPTAGVWNVGTVNPGAPLTLAIAATVVSPFAQTNTATVGGDQFDPNKANNTASATETPQQSDLTLTKTVSNSTPNVGNTITFTITLTNNGPDAATGVQLTDLLPAGLTFVPPATPSKGTYNPTTGVWTVGALAKAATATLMLRAIVASPDSQTNFAIISGADQFDPEPKNNSASATETPQQADLALTKIVSDPSPNVGEQITFTVTLKNNGPTGATNVHVKDLLPPGLAYVSAAASQGTYASTIGVWNVGSLASGAQATLTLIARVTVANPTTNSAGVSAADQFDPDTGNNTANATVTPESADLAVTKVVSDASPNLGDVISYTITLNNLGPDAATGIVLRDRLPAGLRFVSASQSLGTYDSVTGIWTVGMLANGESATLVLNAEVTATTPGTNVATVTAADQFDPETRNNTASAPLNAQQVDLVVGKSVNNSRPNEDEIIVFTVSVTNRGPNTATNVSLSDLVPAGLTDISAIPSQGVYDAGTGIWTIGAVTTAIPATLQIEARVTTPAVKVNRATIIALDQPDANPANNSDQVTVTPRRAELAVTKTVSDSRPDVGDTVTFTVRVTNNGPDAATGVQLTDLLPAGLTLVSADPSQGSYDSASGTWVIGSVANGAAATLLLRATVATPASATNTAAITAEDQFDTVPGNNSDSAAITPLQADLAVTKTVDNPTPNVGDIVTFTVSVHNNGPDAAQNIQITDVLPDGYTLISVTRSRGTFAAATEIWTIPSLAVGATATLTIRARVDAPTTTPNVATITSAATFDPDSTNNSASAGTTVQQTDLVVTKAVDNPSPNVGDTVTFTVTVTNTGPDAATNVRVTDLLPPGLAFVSATPSQGTYTNSTGVWTVGTIASGGTATLALRAIVEVPGQLTNTASISGVDQLDPDPGNNGASSTLSPQQADLVLGKSVDNTNPNVGDTITFTILVRNAGPDEATNVRVTDTIPAGLQFDSATPTQGTYDSISGLWTVGTLTVDGKALLTIRAVATTPNLQLNVARVAGADQFDPDTANNVAQAAVDPLQAELVLTKSVDNSRPNVGDTVTFTVTLENLGPDAATGVKVTDGLPAGVTFVSANPDQGTYDSVTGVWDVGTVPEGETLQLTITATVDSPNAQLNVAAITDADQPDPNPQNNQGSAAIIPQQSDLAVFKSVDNSRPNVGDRVSFTVIVSNLGKSTATNVTLTDLLPAGLALVVATPSQGTYDAGTGVWSVGSVSTSAAQTLVLQATVTSPNPAPNVATVGHSDQFDPDTSNNQAQAVVTPQQANLLVLKSVDNAQPNVGDIVTFTITLNNLGADVATGVVLNDPLPTGLTYVSDAPDQGTYVAATGVWTVGTVLADQLVDLVLRARVTSPGTATNTATISSSDQFDPNPDNNTADASVTSQQADLIVTKAVSNPRPNVGDAVTFTVTVTNIGPDAATGVTIDDALPAGLAFVSATPSQGTYAQTTGVWSVGTIPSGGAATLQLVARVTGSQAVTNIADVGSAAQFDPNPGDNTASAGIQPQAADVEITKTVDIAKPNVGDTVTFTVTVTNHGPDAADGVVVTDFMPVTLQFLTASASVGTYNPATGTWAVGTLANGSTATLIITARVTAPSAATNLVTVRSLQFDPDLANNDAAAVVVPPQADVAVKKSVSAATVKIGQNVTYTIDVRNLGPDSATNVVISDRLPAGVALVSVNLITQGTYDRATGRWSVGTLAPGATARLRIIVRVTQLGKITNTATATLDQFDPVLANNRGAVSLISIAPGKGGFLAN